MTEHPELTPTDDVAAVRANQAVPLQGLTDTKLAGSTDPSDPNGLRDSAPGVPADNAPATAVVPVSPQQWQAVIEHLRGQFGVGSLAGAFKTWLASDQVQAVHVDDGVLLLTCPTPLFRVEISRKFGQTLLSAASKILAVSVRELAIKTSRQNLQAHRDGLQAVQQARLGQAQAAPAAAGLNSDRPVTGRFAVASRGYKILRDFVVGSCNRVAYDAVRQVIEQPGSTWNPLFIHGASGLGKTHLEQGLAVAFKERYPTARVQYISCEQFKNQYLHACENNNLQGFRVKMRHNDLLLVDDIHFLSRGQAQRTKEELFATIRELLENGKTVVITSDAQPRDIKYLEDAFVQRFHGGLVVPLDRPDRSVRAEVVQAKAISQGQVLPEVVVSFIADHITDNVRELEGAVNKLVAYASSYGRSVDVELARIALGDLLAVDSGEPRHKQILRAVADHYELTVEEVLGRSRAGDRATARQIAMYVIRNTCDLTYVQIAPIFGLKSHANVSYACAQVAKVRATDAAKDDFINDLIQRFQR